MRHLQRIKAVLAGLCATVLLTTGGMVGVAHAAQTSPALTADHVIACIRTAAAAHAGLIKEVEVKHKRGQWLCEVEIVDDTGQLYELHVDVTTYQVVKTERD
jgi:uncharacterized membrane protein YkoI